MSAINMISTRAAAAILGISPDTLRGWRAQQKGPQYLAYNSRNVRYDERDVLLWRASFLVAPCVGKLERAHATR